MEKQNMVTAYRTYIKSSAVHHGSAATRASEHVLDLKNEKQNVIHAYSYTCPHIPTHPQARSQGWNSNSTVR